MRVRLGIRWWLALVFALVSGVTLLAAAQLLQARSQAAFRDRASQLAAGRAFEAAIAIAAAEDGQALGRTLTERSGRDRLSLLVFDASGALIAAAPRRAAPGTVPEEDEALETALSGRRFVATDESAGRTLVGLPLTGGDAAALLAYAEHPDLEEGLGIVRREVVIAALWALALGGTVGLVSASLLARRLKRIAATAAEIEAGNFDRTLRPTFMDEVGELAATFDRMRERLRASFGALRSERDRLEALLERLNDGVVAVDEDLVVRVANERARRLLGPELRHGLPLPDPWPPFPLRAAAQRLFDPAAQPLEDAFEPGADRVYVVVGLPPQPGLELALLVVTDVSARERRERAEREFVENASHQLRTPVTTIRGAIELLQGGAKEDRAQRERFLAHIERETARLGRLIRGLLVLARAQAGSERARRESVAIRPLLEAAARELEVADGVEVTVDCPRALRALADADLVEQVVGNLTANAGRATEQGRILLRAEAIDGTVAIEIRDTGLGMSADELERAFERFYRPPNGKPDGVGLGLPIVSAAVDAMGGRLDIESAPERGTIARVVLERADG